MSLRREPIAHCAALALLALAACASPPPSTEVPVRAEQGPSASTRSVPALDASVGSESARSIDPNESSGAGTLLIYSSVAGHVPYRQVTREGVVYRGKTAEELESARAASIEEEIDASVRRQQNIDFESTEQLSDANSLLPPNLEAKDRVPRIAPLAPDPDPAPAVSLGEEELTIASGAWGNSREFTVVQHRIDRDRDGTWDETRFVDAEDGHLLRSERDTDRNGAVDSWNVYDRTGLVRRKRDGNGDGHADVWEEFSRGRLSVERIDRDHDGSIDAIHRYEGISLVEERYDSDADGSFDIVLSYVSRVLVRTEEDRNRNGQTDTWTAYRLIDGEEVAAHVERDRDGDGSADVRKVYRRPGEGDRRAADDLAPL